VCGDDTNSIIAGEPLAINRRDGLDAASRFWEKPAEFVATYFG
jgi:hypothetical protein